MIFFLKPRVGGVIVTIGEAAKRFLAKRRGKSFEAKERDFIFKAETRVFTIKAHERVFIFKSKGDLD